MPNSTCPLPAISALEKDRRALRLYLSHDLLHGLIVQ